MAGREYEQGYRDLTRRVRGYSAQPAYEESTKAAGRLLKRPLQEARTRQLQEQTGRGRVKTGFAVEDEDRMVRDVYDRFYDQIASRGLAAQQLELQARGLEGDLVSGGYDREEAERNAKRKRRGGLFGAIGGIAGGVLGSVVPGVGTALGSYLGGKLGGAVGQYV